MPTAQAITQSYQKSCVMKTLGERDYAAQETMHHLLSLKLHSSSFTVMPFRLNCSRRVQTNSSDNDSDICTDNCLLDVYAIREECDSSPDIMNMNFIQLSTSFKLLNKKLTKPPDNIVPRIFPTYS